MLALLFLQVCDLWQSLQEAVVVARAQQDRPWLRREEVLLRDLWEEVLHDGPCQEAHGRWVTVKSTILVDHFVPVCFFRLPFSTSYWLFGRICFGCCFPFPFSGEISILLPRWAYLTLCYCNLRSSYYRRTINNRVLISHFLVWERLDSHIQT